MDPSTPPPPSYQDAIQRPHWLTLATPFISVRDWARLSRVSKRFYRWFAPRLWNDPIAVARALGVGGDSELEWYCEFVLDFVKHVRRPTREFVKIIDLRGFAQDPVGYTLGFDGENRSITDTLPVLAATFPKLRCLLLDNHPEVDPNPLARNHITPGVEPLLLLSVRGCPAGLDAKLFTSPYLSGLVYLDISGAAGGGTASESANLRQQLSRPALPRLRVLKMEGRALGDRETCRIFLAFGPQLWSLDLSRNRLTDGILSQLRGIMPDADIRGADNDARFEVEGRVAIHPNGRAFVKESRRSADFSHPEKYHIDTPQYSETVDAAASTARATGESKIKDDSASAFTSRLCQLQAVFSESDTRPCQPEAILNLEEVRARALTHLRLNGNNITAQGLALAFATPQYAHLELFECDSMRFKVDSDFFPAWIPPKTAVSGMLGAAHMLRPVFLSNLHALRIHHSLVTKLLTIESDGLPVMPRLWMAETFLYPKAKLAFPQAFVANMNPRIRSLTLTQVPRYSTGSLIKELVAFLDLAAAQGRAISDAWPKTRMGTKMLPGLQHIGFEFEHDPRQELEEMGNSGEQFSFFAESGWGSNGNNQPPIRESPSEPDAGAGFGPETTPKSGRLKRYPFNLAEGRDGEYLLIDDRTKVWIGSGILGPHPAVNEYMRALVNPSLHRRVEPASPGHIVAGVAPGVAIFGEAWNSMLKPPQGQMRRATKADLLGMRDVLAAIKLYRRKTLENHPERHFTGRLTVSCKSRAEYYTASRFWQ